MITPSFTAAQSPLNPGTIILNNTATGSDVTVTEIRVFITDAGGNYIVPAGTTTNYIVWALANPTLTLTDIISEDMALSINCKWVNSGGTMVVEDTQQFCFVLFNKQFAYSLCQGLVPPITLNTNYSLSLASLWTSIKGAINAVVENNDIRSSQNCLNQGTELRLKKNLFF
jgi:hypothetical protein